MLPAAPRVGDPADYLVVAPTRAETHPELHARRRRTIDVSLAIAVPAVLVGAWQVAAAAGWIDTRFFPAPSRIWTSARELIASGDLQHHTLRSVQRMLIGFALGVVSGLVAGFALGMSRTVRAAFEPLLSALYTVPKLALLPLLLLIFGPGETPKIVLIAVTVFFFMWIAVMAAVMSVSGLYREVMQSMRATRWQIFRHVLFPATLPQIFVAMRVSAGVSILVLVGAEFVQGDDGLGYLIWHSWSLFVAHRMYVGIVVVALLGFLFAELVKWIGHLVTPWAPRDEQDRGR